MKWYFIKNKVYWLQILRTDARISITEGNFEKKANINPLFWNRVRSFSKLLLRILEVVNRDLKSRIIVTGVFSGVPKGLFYEVDVGFHFDRHLVFQTRVFFKQIRTNQSFWQTNKRYTTPYYWNRFLIRILAIFCCINYCSLSCITKKSTQMTEITVCFWNSC